MSHEIRTPLNAIVGFSQLLCEETDPVEVAHSTSRILANSKRLLALIDNILDFTRIQSGRARLTEEVFSPFTELQTIHEAALPHLATSALDFAITYDGDPQVNLNADVVRWRQVVNNLVSNALKFTTDGSVHVTGAIRQHEADPDTVWLDVVVTDTGVGIPQDKLEVIFQPFEQVDTSLNRRYEGSGLGLAISERLAELMGGRLRAQSEVGKGSTFCFSVPCALVLAVAAEADEHGISPAVDLAGCRLLIVEDDDNNAEVLRRHLLKAGAAVVDLATEPRAFRRRMELAEYDLIFMDLHLRSVSGIELVRGLRAGEFAGPCRPDVPVFVLTAFTEPELAAEARSAGATRFFTKPASHDAILREVVRVVDSAKAASQS
jgi:CheY-like chemotaxis protein